MIAFSWAELVVKVPSDWIALFRTTKSSPVFRTMETSNAGSKCALPFSVVIHSMARALVTQSLFCVIQFFRSLLGSRWTREGWYDELMNRVDGKALFVRIKKRTAIPGHFLGILAKNLMESPDTSQMFNKLIDEAASKAT